MQPCEEYVSEPFTLIVGAGFAGIAAAIRLKREGFNNFQIVEKAADVGGTWKSNTYPGCTSDVSIHFYSLSTDLKYDWDRTCESQPNILAYVKEVTRKYGLESHISFNSKVISAEWISSTQGYNVTIDNSVSGTCRKLFANIIISAHGIFFAPKLPSIPGLDVFSGPVMHTAEWNDSVDLKGKRVAVIGNGASGSQLVAEISQIPDTEVVQFIRTPHWVLPASILTIHDMWKWVFAYVPFVVRLYRWALFWIFEICYLIIFKTSITRKPLMMFTEYFMTNNVPPEYHSLMIPSYLVGCRRVVFDDGYLASLRQPNVKLRNGEDINSIVAKGIVMEDGEICDFDVIICATGFDVDNFPYLLRGRFSTIEEYFNKKKGPEAYLGVVVPGFPNFYILNGPNTATGYTSVLFFCETQLAYITTLIKPVLERQQVASFEISQEASDNYNAKIQKMFNGTVFSVCGSWYRVGGNGKNVSIFPGSAITYWWWCRNVQWEHYNAVD